jgi:hypothetical protein
VAAKLVVEVDSGKCPCSEAVSAQAEIAPLSPFDDVAENLPIVGIAIFKEAFREASMVLYCDVVFGATLAIFVVKISYRKNAPVSPRA